jgi:uncharacterized protein YjiK
MKSKVFNWAILATICVSILSCGNKTSARTTATESDAAYSADVKVLQVWELPEELNEISANVLVGDDRMACVQDNDGIIFIYNLKTKAIENKITFAGKGDFEGLALVGKTYYVLRSDGFLYEVRPNGNQNPDVKTYDLPLEASNNTEPMFYDAAHNRLLIGTKDTDPGGNSGKGVYSFNLPTKTMSTVPVMMISSSENNGNNNSGSAEKKKGKKHNGEIRPSEIAIEPRSRNIYVLNGPKSQLLLVDVSGKIKSITQLDKKIFPQPEGMCFTSSGELYISSEAGKKGKAVIAKVQL